MKIIIAGGGTGGHIFPAIAIANALKKSDPEIEILFVGAKGKMEMTKVPEAGYHIEGIDITGFNRSSLIKNFGLVWKLAKSFLQVKRIINRFQPDAVLGVGGYTSFPVLRYAQVKSIPTFIHESNSYAGKSNIMIGKKARKVFVATDGMEKFFPVASLMKTGNPVRPSIVRTSEVERDKALHFFNLSVSKKTILIIGGSLGAKSINEAVAAGLDQLVKNGIQLIWQTGKGYIEEAVRKSESKPGIWVKDFINQMEMAYAASDIVVSRAGAMAISELCLVGRPVLFVPYPFASENHQEANARQLVNKGAALMMNDNETRGKLIYEIIRLANDEHKQNELKINILKNAMPGADYIIAKEIIRNIHQ